MASSTHDIPGAHVEAFPLDAHAAATATELTTIFVAPFKCKIRSVAVYFDVAATGNTTNTTNLNLLNAGTAGTGTTELGNIDYATGTDVVVGTLQDLYSPAAPLAVAAGTHLKIQHEKVGTGLALSRGIVLITYEGN